MSEKKNIDQGVHPCLNIQAKRRSDRGNIQQLMRRLRENNRKANNEKFIFVTTAITALIISGIIISF